MFFKSTFAFFAVTLLGTVLSPAQNVSTPDLKGDDSPANTIFRLEDGAMERWRKGDTKGFTDICAPEVTYFDTGTKARLDGLEALKAEYKKSENKIFYDVMEFIAPRIQVYGDTAVLFYRFFSTILNPDGSVKSRIPWNCSEVYAKIDGKWQIVHTHWSFIKGTRQGAESEPEAGFRVK